MKNTLNIITMNKTNYHRNGIGGVGFYSAVVSYKDTDGVCPDMLVTFEAEGAKVDTETCRVISLNDPTLCWRGDVIAEALNRFFKKNEIKDLYSYMKNIG